ncbi:MAG: glycosyltransferase family 2 protein, partial [Planctomycetes bacterium]|nr:glycosyltransferase family 2 protein [Planctomycetota bacterium]
MDASIIIPAFGRTDLLRRTLTAALAQDYPADAYEVIVVDSSPDDANERLVRGLAPSAPCRLRVLRKDPEGPGPSRNAGARASAGRILAFLDSDCLPVAGWLAAGVAAFDEGVGLVQGRTVPDPDARLGPLTGFLRIERESFIYEAGNMFYRREAFFQTDGFHADPHGGRFWVLGGED